MNEINVNEVFAAFKRSGKKHILITGKKGSGKTTLARALAGERSAGFETYAVPRKEVVLRHRLTGETSVIGLYDEGLGTMVPVESGFQLGIKAAEQAMDYEGSILLDEIGYLENNMKDFQGAVKALLDRKSLVLTTRKEDTDFILSLKSRDDVFVLDVDVLRGNLGCVIMASGYGKRFGSNKLLCDFGGKKLAERAILATDGVFSRRVVVTRYKEVADICEREGVECVLHDLPRRSDTVKLGLEKMDGTAGCAFCPCDQPLLKRETVMALTEGFCGDKEKIRRLSCKEKVGMPVIFPEKLYGELLALEEGGGSAVIKKHPEMLCLHEIREEYEMADADTPEELEFLAKQCL